MGLFVVIGLSNSNTVGGGGQCIDRLNKACSHVRRKRKANEMNTRISDPKMAAISILESALL